MTYGTYRLLTRLTFALTFPVFLVYAGITGRHRAGLRQRLGFYTENDLPKSGGAPVVWIHGASVGEVMVAGILAARIKAEFPEASLILSTVTAQGLEIARKQLGKIASCLLAPLDIPGAADRAAAAIQPDLYICLETELWPNLLRRLKQDKVRLFLSNGRLSERSYLRYRLAKGFTREILAGFEAISAISNDDAERFAGLGGDRDRITVTGNVKYDLAEPAATDKTRDRWRQELGLAESQPVLVAGSTHTGEEEMLLEVFQGLKGEIEGLVLIIAPRHLKRITGIREGFDESGIRHELLSSLSGKKRTSDIILVDTMGDLAEIYSVADFIFCGGSLVERGGHNIMEAAVWGVPVFYGTSMNDFKDARQLLEGHGGISVKSHNELADRVLELFRNTDSYKETAEAARRTALSQQGAADRQLAPIFDAIRTICSNNGRI